MSPKPAIRTWLIRQTEVGMYDPPAIFQPRLFPWITDLSQGLLRPHACLFHAFFHAHDPDALPVLKVALKVARTLEPAERQRYTAMLQQFTKPEMNAKLQDYLRSEAEEPEPDEWDMACAGWQQAVAKATHEGKLEGKLEGKAEGLGRALLDILELRGLAPDPLTRARVQACHDLVQLERWYEQAKRASSLGQIFG